jgi:endogenous inhibitor of DNA gyrase (YacG/DUF329 family)
MPKSEEPNILDIRCPRCGADLETYCWEFSGTRPHNNEFQAPCPHCQKELLMWRVDKYHWEVEAA